jgi:hypothetical protein
MVSPLRNICDQQDSTLAIGKQDKYSTRGFDSEWHLLTRVNNRILESVCPLATVWGIVNHLGGRTPANNPGPGDRFDELQPLKLSDD